MAVAVLAAGCGGDGGGPRLSPADVRRAHAERPHRADAPADASRASVLAAVRSAILRDARARAREGALRGPFLGVDCDVTGDDARLAARRPGAPVLRYRCLAVTARSATPAARRHRHAVPRAGGLRGAALRLVPVHPRRRGGRAHRRHLLGAARPGLRGATARAASSARRGGSAVSTGFATERLRVRPPVRADEARYARLFAAPAVSAWLRPPPLAPFGPSDARLAIDRDAAQWAAEGFGFGVVLAHEGEFLGRGGLMRAEVEGEPAVELGWALLPEHQGRGLATELALGAIAFARSRGVAAVVALTLPDNTASRRVMERAGMAFDREVEHAGLPHVLYGLTL